MARKGHGRGETLGAPGNQILLRRRAVKIWAKFVRWDSHPLESHKPVLVLWTARWGGREIHVDMANGATISGIVAWYLDQDQRAILLHEAITGSKPVKVSDDVLLPRAKLKKKKPLFAGHKTPEQLERIKNATPSKASKFGRPRSSYRIQRVVKRDEGQ